jgi:DNA polymerase I-like protein with 3'-5' exonuclease and polymerase domains
MAKKFTRYFVGDYKIDGFINISLVEACSKIKDKVALDTETTWDEAKEILTVQITGKDYTILVDVQEGFSKMLLGKLKKIGWICHNGKFDYSVIKRHTGYVHNDVDDTMVMGQLIKLGLTNPKGTFSLESMAREYVDKYAYTLQTDLFDYTVTKDIRRTFGGKLTPQQAAYAAKDTEYTYTLYEVLHAKMEKDGLLDVYNLVEKEFILVLADMELNGVDVNRDK